MIENKEYIQFEMLRSDELIHLFTKRPFNFNKIIPIKKIDE